MTTTTLHRSNLASPRETPSPAVAFVLLGTVQATLILTITILGVPLPEIGREFGLGPADLVLLTAAYGLPFSGLLLFGGRLADRYGGRRMFVLGLVVFAIASGAAAFAPTFAALVGTRSAQGVGAAATAPAAMAVLRAVYPEPAAYRRAMATWGGLSVAGAATGNVASGVVTGWVSWRALFAVPVLVAVVALASARRVLPAARPDGATRPGLDPVGAALATVGVTVVGYGLTMTGADAWTSPTVAVPLGVGIALLGAFLLVERRVAKPLLPPGFVRTPRRALGLVGILLAAAGTGLITFLVSLHLQQQRGWSAPETAAAFVPFTAALLATARVARPLIGRFGARRVTIAGLAVGGVGLLLLTRIEASGGYAATLAPGLVLLPVGASLIFAGAAVLITHDVPAARAGLAGGVLNTAMELGPTVGLAALMSVAATRADVTTGYAWAFGTAGAAYLLTAAAAALLLHDLGGDDHAAARSTTITVTGDSS